MWYALYCLVPLIPFLFDSHLMLFCVMHYWCGKERMHILHKSKSSLPFQECTGNNPPDKDFTYNCKNGHKRWMVAFLKEPRNATGPPVIAHSDDSHYKVYMKHRFLLPTFSSTPTKACQAPYLLCISIIALGKMDGENQDIGGQVFASLNSSRRKWGVNGHGIAFPLAFSRRSSITFEYLSGTAHKADVPR